MINAGAMSYGKLYRPGESKQHFLGKGQKKPTFSKNKMRGHHTIFGKHQKIGKGQIDAPILELVDQELPPTVECQ